MATKLMVHTPKGGQGKTTLAANLGMMLADAGRRVLLCDCCSSGGLELYFNLDLPHGMFELLAAEAELPDLVGEIRPGLFFLPGGRDDLARAERVLDQIRVAPFRRLQQRMQPWEDRFDVILFDTSPDESHKLFYAMLYYVDRILTPVETKRAGLDLVDRFATLLDEINPELREQEGKPPLRIGRLVPYWHGNSNVKNGALELMRERFGGRVTEPVGECTGLAECWIRGEALQERVSQSKSPRPNEERIVQVLQGLVDDVLEGR